MTEEKTEVLTESAALFGRGGRRGGIDHAGVAALLAETKRQYAAGNISLREAATIRLVARNRPEQLAASLEEVKQTYQEPLTAPNAAMSDWTADEWSQFIGTIFKELIAALPVILGLCA